MTGDKNDKSNKKLAQVIREVSESIRDEGPELVQEFVELVAVIREKLPEVTQKIGEQDKTAKGIIALYSDLETYTAVVDFLLEQIERDTLRIVVIPQGWGNFFFYLFVINQQDLDAQRSVHAIELSVEQINQIVNKEIFSVLRYVYREQLDAFVDQARISGESASDARERYFVTEKLLTPALQDHILLAQTQTAHTLFSKTHDIISRDLQVNGMAATLHSALIKLNIRDNQLGNESDPYTTVTFECTVDDIRGLIDELNAIVEELIRRKD